MTQIYRINSFSQSEPLLKREAMSKLIPRREEEELLQGSDLQARGTSLCLSWKRLENLTWSNDMEPVLFSNIS